MSAEVETEGLTDAHDAVLSDVAERLLTASRVLFITGAGLSVESGLPTYRGVGGFYDRPEGLEDGLSIEQIMSGPTFRRSPELTWKYLHEKSRLAKGKQPNIGHEVIAWLEARIPGMLVLTQNVDGFHTRAGSKRVIDIHGDMGRLVCTTCDWEARVASYEGLDALPRCPECGAVIRPDVVLFGEALEMRKLALLFNEVRQGFELVVVVGTSVRFPYVTDPVYHALERGIPVLEINPEDTELSDDVTWWLPLRAGVALARLRSLMMR